MPLPNQTFNIYTNQNGSSGDDASVDLVKIEAARFEAFYQHIYDLHEVLEKLDNITNRRRMRQIVNKLEDDFIACPEFTIPRTSSLHELRLGLVGGSLSGKSSLVLKYLTGINPKDEVLSGRHKKAVIVDGQNYLLLIRDETGPPDIHFATWMDAVLLVFSLVDELSFNVISSYCAKITQHCNRRLPAILVAIKDGINHDMPSMIGNARIKKFVMDHGNCPMFVASLSTGEKIKEIFQTAAEIIVRSLSNSNIPADAFMSPGPQSNPPLDMQSGPGYGSTLSISSQGSLKKHKKKGALFSKSDKKEDIPDDIGSGRKIPVKQGYLYKKSHNSIKEWKKKYVTICDNGTLSYYPNMKDYMDENNAKSVNLVHTTVKVQGRRPPRALNQEQGNRSSPMSMINCDSSPRKSNTIRNSQSLQSNPKAMIDAYIISNSLASEKQTSPSFLFNDVLDKTVGNATQNVLVSETPNNFEISPSKRKHKRHGGRHSKSCEIDYIPGSCRDAEFRIQGNNTTPITTRKKVSHRRIKSGVEKELQFDKATDTEDDDLVFTLVSLDGKSWDFEATSLEERDGWVQRIEKQIARAFQMGIETPTKERLLSNNTDCSSTVYKTTLRSLSGNDRCADCGSPDPDWASLNLGILVCIECSGVHRNLGTHLSRVRSIELDEWPSECMAVMSVLGNEFANSLWEASTRGKRKPAPNATREEREWWIQAKYEKREFMAPLDLTSKSLGQRIIDAVKKDDHRTCYTLLAHSSPQVVNTKTNDKEQQIPLHLSCASGNIILTQLLLWNNANPRTFDANGHAPMYFARKIESRQCAELLQQFGCLEDTPC